MEQIILENITKKYHGTAILNQISHTFSKGQSAAFMGHNGCGKSTLLKIISGLVRPTSGSVHCGGPILFHYVPEKFIPVPLTARTYLRRMAELDGLKKRMIDAEVEGLGDDFFLSELLDVPMKHLSKGTLQKIGVIQALIRTPDVLLLDEPLSGQDAASQKVFIRKINELRSEGVTVLMACHEQSLVDAVAEEVYTIENGEFVRYRHREEKRYVILLESKQNNPPREGMQRYGSGYRMTVEEDKVKSAIMELFDNGWELRGMYNEEGK